MKIKVTVIEESKDLTSLSLDELIVMKNVRLPKVKTKSTPWRGSWSDSIEEDDEKDKDETCLVAQASSEICLGVELKANEWIKDSRCSKHMMGNQNLFSTYKVYNRGNIIFGSNLRGNIIGKAANDEVRGMGSRANNWRKD
nr:retrovirus-related Pol polyprotein from transposon TNT 1-94 [Tanacetum cinerariifolium]